MNDLYIALGYETLSGQMVGVLLGFCIVAWAFVRGPRFFQNPHSQKIFFLAVLLRFVLIILSVEKIFNPPESDFIWFETDAAQIALGLKPFIVTIASADNFNAFQAFFFSIFGASFFLADAIGLLGFAISTIVLGRLIKLLELAEFEPWILLPFCFLPGSLIYLNYNSREVFQVLFLILTIHGILQYRMSGRIMSLIRAVAFGYLFAVTHNRYIVVVPVFIGIGVFLPNFGRTGGTTWTRILVFPVAIALVVLMNYVSNSQGFLNTVTDTGLVNYVNDLSYISESLTARTQFPYLLTSTDPLAFLAALPIMMVQFIFAPIIPFMIRAPIDVLPAIDSLLRVVLLFGTIRLIRNPRASNALRDAAQFMLICYFVFCGVSLLGTHNVGTQQRHQIMVEWVLMIMGAPVIASMLSARARAYWRMKVPQVRRAHPVLRRR